MNGRIKIIENIIDRIEEELTGNINYESLASSMALSVYEFRRIFSFVVGYPLSDYVRKRRLSLAACDIMQFPDMSIENISEKYGYSAVSAFSKAFREEHGISPSQLRKEKGSVTLFSKPEFEINIKNESVSNVRITEDTAFSVVGLTEISDYTDTECCEGVWEKFYQKEFDAKITGDSIYAVYSNSADKVECTIGSRTNSCQGKQIPKSRWLCVRMNTTNDDAVNARYSSIVFGLIESMHLKRREDLPVVEVFPKDMTDDNFEWEIKIAIKGE